MEGPSNVVSRNAGEALAALRFVIFDGNTMEYPAAAGAADGVVQYGVSSGVAGSAALLSGDRLEVTAGETITAGDLIRSSDAGKAEIADTADDVVLGIAITGGAADAVIEVQPFPRAQYAVPA